MVRRLEGIESVADTVTIERQCDREFLEPLAKTANDYNAILSTDCGAGVQFLAEHFEEKIVLPGLNTSFIGVTEAVGVWGWILPRVQIYLLCLKNQAFSKAGWTLSIYLIIARLSCVCAIWLPPV